jgi:hypothetical protein
MPKPKKRRCSSIMGRSDIPYAQRMAMQHRSDIVVNREHFAKIIMFCMSVSMHQTEGIGYKRLVIYSHHFKELIDEFYADPEVGMAHVVQRMEQIGMPISGEIYAVEVPGLTKRDQQIHDHSMQAAQVAQFIATIAMNDVFGYAHVPLTRIAERASELAKRYKKEGEQFLLDEMKEIGFPVVNGKVLAYMDEDGKPIMPSRAKKEGYPVE